MKIFKAIGNWFKSLFDKVRTFIKKAWKLAAPFLQEVLSETANNIWASSQDLFIAAAQYVASQGLPTDEEKQKAFKDYMAKAASAEVEQLKDNEFNLLREMAVAIFKKVTAK